MHKDKCALLIATLIGLTHCKISEDAVVIDSDTNKIFAETINFDVIDFKKPFDFQGPPYLPPSSTSTESTTTVTTPGPTPPKPGSTPSTTTRKITTPPPIRISTSGEKYLPPPRNLTTRSTIRPISYMPTMGTFPPTRTYSYKPYTYTYRPYSRMPTPRTLPPLTTTTRTTGYYYTEPSVKFQEGGNSIEQSLVPSDKLRF